MPKSPPTNPLAVKCPTDRCQCTVFQPGTATLVQRTPREKLPELGKDIAKDNREMPDVIKNMLATHSKDTLKNKTEGMFFWLVDDVMAFDNVGVSHTKNGIKYLSCADCDLAPIGYYDIEAATAASGSKKHEYLIAVDRVAYKQQQK
ncbi:hypothetical protein IWW38_002919 [Coemansia aciculifera]|uniref:Uncharacterized protein n=1 Tax=Coemansia aciculifera TaxID=417176 RepID=A0ACC1M3X0_9FUNG|nr:hypothetical protein IWW38_002919 [Coemansia aciculifera]